MFNVLRAIMNVLQPPIVQMRLLYADLAKRRHLALHAERLLIQPQLQLRHVHQVNTGAEQLV